MSFLEKIADLVFRTSQARDAFRRLRDEEE